MSAPDPTRLRKHSVRLAGHLTSISIEDAFWERLVAIADAENLSINSLISQIDAARTGDNSVTVTWSGTGSISDLNEALRIEGLTEIST